MGLFLFPADRFLACGDLFLTGDPILLGFVRAVFEDGTLDSTSEKPRSLSAPPLIPPESPHLVPETPILASG